MGASEITGLVVELVAVEGRLIHEQQLGVSDIVGLRSPDGQWGVLVVPQIANGPGQSGLDCARLRHTTAYACLYVRDCGFGGPSTFPWEVEVAIAAEVNTFADLLHGAITA
ncbi:MAG TPA: hypothetical protein VLE99_05390 [Candidatus Saccharimonadales bacterium]|nr:hypothetical protein [Candidatus Saccharimonadales bacterium]